MPKRTDIKKILIIGSGPIVIGQACEFDYSGAQACKALKEEGYQVVLVNSNPATIMTDPTLADRTYIEPLTPEILVKIIEKERPDAVLPTLGGQTALNLALTLFHQGVFEQYGVEMLGANAAVIEKAESRQAFKEAMEKIGLSMAKSFIAYTVEEAAERALELGFPCVVRPAFTLGGLGGGIAYNLQELEEIATLGLRHSLISEVLIEESIIGWKEFELEVMRDCKDNVVIVCSIENLDPMGVHTGDSITVAPIQTLTDREYQVMRDAAVNIIREIGVETGGANIQFAVNPVDGRMMVIELNPRVSRSSALASKATGFPIAKFAAKLAVGYTLDELDNDITQKTPACFEPSIDYCVVKIPRFNLEKFPQAACVLGTAMKSVGEAMGIGRTFKEALQKGLQSLEIKRFGFGGDGVTFSVSPEALIGHIKRPTPERIFYVQHALANGMSTKEVAEHSLIDPWFVEQMASIVRYFDGKTLSVETVLGAKRWGFSDVQIAHSLGLKNELDVRQFRKANGIEPTFKSVDTCAAEFEAYTPYFYSTYESENEAHPSTNQKVMILGGGPNRIGQGIEFDYCCVHASQAVRDAGFDSIMMNSNPETVSTDFDISTRLYFEPVTLEHVLNVYENENPMGVIIQFGGQTPLNLAKRLEAQGVRILGTSPDAIDRAEDRKRFQSLIEQLKLRQPNNGTATSVAEAVAIAQSITYPIVVRPSYVLGGASMEIVYDDAELERYMRTAIAVSPEHPILIDHYLTDAVEVDVDAVSDGTDCVVAGIMEHIEEAGIHSGDSACVFPPHSIQPEMLDQIRKATQALAIELQVIGLLNIQFAIKDDLLYVLEVNPRASRTVPFLSKATGIQWAKVATQLVLGTPLLSLGLSEPKLTYCAVKEAVFSFNKLPGADIILGPEMKSTGEVMGIDRDFGMAFIKAQLAAGQSIPMSGKIFLSVKDADKPKLVGVAKRLIALGFELMATKGTGSFLAEHGIETLFVDKLLEGRPNIVDHIKSKMVKMVINTPSGKNPLKDEVLIRQSAMNHNVPVITTMAGAIATSFAMNEYMTRKLDVKPLQDYYHSTPAVAATVSE